MVVNLVLSLTKSIMKKYISLNFTLLLISLLICSLPLNNLLAQTGIQSVFDVEIETNRDPGLCIGESITLTVDSEENPDSVQWTPESLFSNSAALSEEVFPEETVLVTLTVFVGDTSVQRSLEIIVDQIFFPEFSFSDTTICQGEKVNLTEPISPNNNTYEWIPSDSLSDPNSPAPVAIPSEDITYSLLVNSANGFCEEERDSLMVNVLPNEVDILLEDTTFICDDENVITLSTRFNPPTSNFQWFPNDGSLSDPNSSSPEATVEFSTRYIVRMNTPDGCESRDTVLVRLDSLPKFDFAVVPDPNPNCDKYCRGDFLTIFSNPTNPERFPDIRYSWEPEDGSIQDSLHFQNIAVEASESQYYIRTNINNGCTSLDSVWIDVVDPDLPISLSDTTVCANMPVEVSIDPTDLSEIEWQPAEGLSCTDCPNPTITASETTTYTVTATKEECCPVSASVTVNVFFPPIPIAPVITCPGEPVQIQVDSEGFNSPMWSPGQQLSCTDCFEPIATVNTSTSFQLTAFDEMGCESRGTASVALYPEPDQLSIEVAEGNEIPIGTNGTFSLISEPPIPVDGIVWFYNGEEVDDRTRSTTIRILEEGANNIISAVVIDENGCEWEVNINISGVEPIFEVPNVFSPGDQSEINQFFRPVVVNAELFDGSFISDFKVFSRWGEMVYNNDNNDQGWDGRQGGSRAPSDVYVYVIEITLPNGTSRTLKGDVTLLR